MRRALIFNGVFIMGAAFSVFFIRGKQVRRELDELKTRQSLLAKATRDGI
jgi:hypothetical protein